MSDINVADLAQKVMNGEDIDASALQTVLPSHLAQSLLRLGKVCGRIDTALCKLEDRVARLESKNV